MKNKFTWGLLLILYSLAGILCKKSKADKVPVPQFTWIISGITYKADTDTAYLSLRPLAIIARKDINNAANARHFEINLTSFSVGEYSLDFSLAGQVAYRTGGIWITSAFGKVYITENTGSTLSGNFTATLSDNSIVTGNFSGVPIKP